MAARLESVWFDQTKYELAEGKFQSILANRHEGLVIKGKGVNSESVSIATEIGRAMDLIGKSLNSSILQAAPVELEKRVAELEKENAKLKTSMDVVMQRLSALESKTGGKVTKESVEHQPAPCDDDDDDDDDDFDLFDDVDEEEVAKLHEERQKKLSKKDSSIQIGSDKVLLEKPKHVAKSSIILDIKPWDDETDMSEMEKLVRLIEKDGLLWGASKTVPVAYGIKKLQICCVVEDDKVGTDFLEESITAIEDLVQSMDIVAFNKI